MYNTLSYTYMHLLVLISYLLDKIFMCVGRMFESLKVAKGKVGVMTVFAEMTVEEILQLALDNVSIIKSNREIEDLQVYKKLLIKKLKCMVKQYVSILN